MSRYSVHVTPAAWKAMKELPAQVRQRVKTAVSGIAENPRPPKSKAMELSGLSIEARRLLLDRWRIIYVIAEDDAAVDVLAIRKRPPYDYGDLESLLKDYLPK